MSILATCLGHPRIGVDRELKKSLEAFWSKKITAEQLEGTARMLRRRHWLAMKEAGIDHIPSNDFSLYDHVLDTAVLVGAVPARYRPITDPLARTFAMARGLQDPAAGLDIPALEMTKWYDTNYHYIVPEVAVDQEFQANPTKLLGELAEARALGIEPRPVILGPVTFLLLSKLARTARADASPLDLLGALLPVYERILSILADHGVGWVQLDEPALVAELDARTMEAFRWGLRLLSSGARRPRLLLTTYFGGLRENLSIALQSGCEAIHLDLVRAPEQLEPALATIGPTTILSMGVVDGRNVWRTDLDHALGMVARAVQVLGPERIWVGPSCSFLHTPIDLGRERKLDDELKTWLAFTVQKVDELRALADVAGVPPDGRSALRDARFEAARAALASRRRSSRTRDLGVRKRMAEVTPDMLRRRSGYEARAGIQRARFGLPLMPTTTIGSFPQTREVREARAAWRAGQLTDDAYQSFLREETRRCVAEQETIGLDVLVHGEFERTDMAEYFGEQLDGFAFTENGWVQSYGSRCVKPPILFGDVVRPRAMTVAWTGYAQSLTKRPMKGMLTGPVTILQWSFVRDDQPRADTCMQIALALRDEVTDLERAGVSMIQVDEPAIREGLPLRRADYPDYLRWSIDAFRLATASVADQTQIHTHMCYAEFGDILEGIAAMDADVLSIETSRSKMELLGDFGTFRYPNEVGPGVYDIHAPRVPSVDEMRDLLTAALKVLPADRLWVNPDCGLKTRGWPEVKAALSNLVEAARHMREAAR